MRGHVLKPPNPLRTSSGYIWQTRLADPAPADHERGHRSESFIPNGRSRSSSALDIHDGLPVYEYLEVCALTSRYACVQYPNSRTMSGYSLGEE